MSALPAPFRWEGEHLAIDLPGGEARFTTRRGGVSEGPYESLNLGLWTDDDPAAVGANRDLLAVECGIPRERFAQGRQVHGTQVNALREPPAPDEEPAEADGQATRLQGVAPVVLTADCLPIALSSGDGVAMLHAGWRGLAGGIIGRGVALLRGMGARGELVAAIGPGAGPCCYEAGDEVHEAIGRSVGRNVDLKAAAREQLEAAGVAAIHDVGLCTICSELDGAPLFFSHRRERGVTGRQAGVAWLD